MDQSTLKIGWKQRLFIIIIAALLLGSTVAVYIGIILGSSDSQADAKLAELSAQYATKSAEVDAAADDLSDQYLATFANYKNRVKSYNAESANAGGLKSTDLKVGSGAKITSDSENYFAYYIGWCADESVFDSSFDDFTNPTKLTAPLSGGPNLIEGWVQGVAGMKIGGVRELTIPGELAYGDSREICGGTNSPLKFVVMAIEKSEPLATLSEELNEIGLRYQYASYGLDYDELMSADADESTEAGN